MEFNYHSPKTETELTVLLKGLENYCLLAGGTDLLVKMKEKLIAPKTLVDINGVDSLKGISEAGGCLQIGALVTHRELAKSTLIRKNALVLAEAAEQVGSPQIRNMGTIGGNIGNASPAADTVPAMLVMDARTVVHGFTGQEECPLIEIFLGPGRTSLKPGQYISRLILPALGPDEGVAFLKFGKRKALACAIVNGASWVRVENGMIRAARIALGAVAATPVRLHDVERWLVGKKAEDAIFAAAGKMAESLVKPIDDVRCTASHRVQLTNITVARTLKTAAVRAREVCFCG